MFIFEAKWLMLWQQVVKNSKDKMNSQEIGLHNPSLFLTVESPSGIKPGGSGVIQLRRVTYTLVT